jgi:hypothetical protein
LTTEHGARYDLSNFPYLRLVALVTAGQHIHPTEVRDKNNPLTAYLPIMLPLQLSSDVYLPLACTAYPLSFLLD